MVLEIFSSVQGRAFEIKTVFKDQLTLDLQKNRSDKTLEWVEIILETD